MTTNNILNDNEVIKEEIEALRAIFENDFKVLKPVWSSACVELKLCPHLSLTGQDKNAHRLFAVLKIIYSRNYPVIPPRCDLVECKGITSEKKKELSNEIVKKLGELANKDCIPMIYEVSVFVNKFLVDNFIRTGQSFYELYKAKEKEKQVIQKQLDEEDAAKNEEQRRTLLQRLNQLKRELLEEKFESEEIPVVHELSETPGVPEPDLKGWLENAEKTSSRFRCDFQEFEILGKGGYGQVVRCMNRLDGRNYAIKKLKLKKGDLELNKKTLREVTSLAKMFHENIVRYYQAWIEDLDLDMSQDDEDEDEDDSMISSSEDDTVSWNYGDRILTYSDLRAENKILYIQMEYCSGLTLRQVIDAGELCRSDNKIWKAFRQLLEALWYIHDSCHLIHRDIKPANVFFDQKGNVKLGDFGLAVKVVKTNETHEQVSSDGSNNEIDAKSTGVGTTLYRAPEVHGSANYNEKCDMFSLGIVLFEMLNPPFSTGMERHITLTKLRDFPQFTTDSEIVQSLLQHRPELRPSAFDLLESGKIPNQAEADSRYLDQVIRTIHSNDKTSPLYGRVINSLFKQKEQRELFYLYDIDLFAKGKKHQKHNKATFEELGNEFFTLRSSAITQKLHMLCAKSFELNGAVHMQTSLLTPKFSTEDDTSIVQLVDSNGNIVELPSNLTKPFARWLAIRGVSLIKRYAIENTYLPLSQQRTTLGRQPLSQVQACFDSVMPMYYLEEQIIERVEEDSPEALSEEKIQDKEKKKHGKEKRRKKKKFASKSGYVAPNRLSRQDSNIDFDYTTGELEAQQQILQCAVETLAKCGIDPGNIVIKVGDVQKQREAFQKCGIITKHDQETVCNILRNHQVNSKWLPLRRQLLETFNAKQADGLRKCIYHAHKIELPYDKLQKKINKIPFSLFLNTIPDFSTSFFFRIYLKQASQRLVFIGEGGRYDQLVQLYDLNNSIQRFALGLRLFLSKISNFSSLRKGSFQDYFWIDVLLCALSESDVIIHDRSDDLADNAIRLREVGISVETVCPPLASTDKLIAYCKHRGIAFIVFPRNNLYRVRDVLAGTTSPNLRFDDLVQYIMKNRGTS